MRHIAELIGVTPAEVLGTGTFYEMFKFEPVGKYLINVCGTMSCAKLGADDLMHAAEEELGIHEGGTTDDGLFTLHRAECQAACTEAPCLQVNYRYRFRTTPVEVRQLISDLRSGRLDDEIPPHGTLARACQHIPADKGGGSRPVSGHESTRMDYSISGRWCIMTSFPGHQDLSTVTDRRSTSRFQYEDSHTLERLLATGGYEGLRSALARSPHDMHEEVRSSTLLGRVEPGSQQA